MADFFFVLSSEVYLKPSQWSRSGVFIVNIELWTNFTPCSSAFSAANFEQVNAGWIVLISGPYETFATQLLAKIINGQKIIIVSAKCYIMNVWHNSKYSFVNGNLFAI